VYISEEFAELCLVRGCRGVLAIEPMEPDEGGF